MNTKIMNKLHLKFFFNIFSLTFLSWINHLGTEVGNHNIYLNKNYLNSNSLNIRYHRLLINNDTKSEIEQCVQSDNITPPGEQNVLNDFTDSSEIYEKKKKDTSNSMYTYIKKLQHEYPNKKGLKRLNCHYEKKLFDEMYKLDKSAGHMKSKNSYFKKVIWKRYGLRFVIFSLVLLFGIAMSILCKFGGSSCDSGCNHANIETYMLGIICSLYIPLIIAFLYFIIYILSKIRKYKRLKRKYVK